MAAEGDVDLIVYGTFFRDRKTGVMVEVGAARPDYLSIGADYRCRGWRIIAIEPKPKFCAAHRALGYDVLQYACSDEDADGVPFFVVDSHGVPYVDGLVSYESFSSLGIKGGHASLLAGLSHYTGTTIPVQVRRLDSILAQHAPDICEIDLLAVDVEGWELKVLRGIDLAKYRPKVVILENLTNDASYLSFMRGVGYIYWKHIELNDVYVRADLKPFIPARPMREVAKEWVIRAGLLEVARRVKRATEGVINSPFRSNIASKRSRQAASRPR
jgi:FkbM family methyltransferase